MAQKVIAFSGSNSRHSINSALIRYTASQLESCDVISLTDYDVPMYGIDLENINGIPEGIKDLMHKIMTYDAVIISTPEHNSLMPAFFKNILDWLSRTRIKYLEEKNVIVMSAAPGKGGAKNAGDYVEKIIGYAGANVVGRFSLPLFPENFDISSGKIVNEELDLKLKNTLDLL